MSKETTDAAFWRLTRRGVKKSFIPAFSLGVIDLLLQGYFDYRVSRLTIIAILFVIVLAVSVSVKLSSQAKEK